MGTCSSQKVNNYCCIVVAVGWAGIGITVGFPGATARDNRVSEGTPGRSQ